MDHFQCIHKRKHNNMKSKKLLINSYSKCAGKENMKCYCIAFVRLKLLKMSFLYLWDKYTAVELNKRLLRPALEIYLVADGGQILISYFMVREEEEKEGQSDSERDRQRRGKCVCFFSSMYFSYSIIRHIHVSGFCVHKEMNFLSL